MTNASGSAPCRNFSLAQRKNLRSLVATPASLSWAERMVKMLDHSSPMADVSDELDARSRRVREIELRNVAASVIVAVQGKSKIGLNSVMELISGLRSK